MLHKYGDNTEPCLTPKFTSKQFDHTLHLTQASQDDDQFSRTMRSSMGMRRFVSFKKDHAEDKLIEHVRACRLSSSNTSRM